MGGAAIIMDINGWQFTAFFRCQQGSGPSHLRYPAANTGCPFFTCSLCLRQLTNQILACQTAMPYSTVHRHSTESLKWTPPSGQLRLRLRGHYVKHHVLNKLTQSMPNHAATPYQSTKKHTSNAIKVIPYHTVPSHHISNIINVKPGFWPLSYNTH